MDNRSLFDRLGGRPGIDVLVDDIVALHLENPAIGVRFRPYLETPEKLAAVKRNLGDFLESGGGGTAQYRGKTMPEAHRGMNIGAAEYMAALDDILSALKRRGIDEQTQKDVLAVAYSLKGDILHH